MRTILVVACLFLVVAACAALQTTSSNTSPQQPVSEQPARNQGQAQAVTPLVSPPTIIINTQQNTTEERASTSTKQPYPWREWLIPQTLSNLFVAIVGIGAFVIGVCTLRIVQAQTRVNFAAYKSSRRASNAAIRAADAAVVQANFTAAQKRISDKQLRLLYAPCFELEGPTTASFDLDDDDPTIKIVWEVRNTGAAPIHFRGLQSVAATIDAPVEIAQSSPLLVTIGVNRTLPVRLHAVLSIKNREEYKAGRLTVDVDMTFAIFDPTVDVVAYYRRQRRILCGLTRDNPADIMRAIDSAGQPDPNDEQNEQGQSED